MLSRLFMNLRLSRTLILALSVFALVPVAIAAVFGTTLLDHVVRSQTETTLRVAANLMQATILEFFDYLKNQTLDVADDFYIRDSLAAALPDTQIDRDLAVNRSHIPESEELFVLNNAGRVVASSDAASIGRDDSATDYFQSGRERVHLGDMARGADGRLRWIIAAPIRDRHSGARLGVLANRIDPRALSNITTGRKFGKLGIPDESLRRGRTGELYLVNRDGFMITESRFTDQAFLTTRLETLPVRSAMNNGTHVLGDYTDYRGVPVTGASALIPPLGWVVVVEVDHAEAIRPVRRLQIGLAWLGMALVPAVAIVGLVIHRSVVRPMRSVLSADERVRADGRRSGLLEPSDFRYVEWQRLVAGRNVMLSRLHEQSERLQEQLETERLYRQIQEVDRRKDVFLATLAHELRNPLTAITTSAHALAVLPPEDETKRGKLRSIISHQATNIARLVDELLDVSRIAAGKLSLRLRAVNLTEALRHVVDSVVATGRVQEEQIVISEAGAPLTVMADMARLEQVFRNLLDNAIKYSPPAAPIHISVEPDAGDAVVRISDNGIGIAPDDLPGIFDTFRQTQVAVRQAGDGLGLGLALVRALVEQHGGRITATSGGLGKGSEFEVRLRLAPSTPSTAPDTPARD
jgi:signal transduction histidine kinase